MKQINITPPKPLTESQLKKINRGHGHKWYKDAGWNWQQQLGFWLLMLTLITFAVAFGCLVVYLITKIIFIFTA